jgi:hypothetical protein
MVSDLIADTKNMFPVITKNVFLVVPLATHTEN